MTYAEFIDNILITRGRRACGNEYHEEHHILPKCCNGTDDEDNLIDLFAREHFIAHKLLAEENPENEKLVYAWWAMSIKSYKTVGRYELTPEEYESAKIALSKIKKGKSFTEEHKQLLSESAKERYSNPENHPMYGKHMSEESKQKMSQAKKGKPSPKRGIPVSEEQKKKLQEYRIGSKWTQKQHEKMDGRYANGNSTCCIPIYCPELDEYFWGLQEACDKYGFTKPNISKCLKGERKHSGKHPVTGEKLTWQYVENN